MDSKKQSRKRIAVIPGDGIGQEVIPQAVKVIQASGAAVQLTDFDWGADRYLRDQTTVPAHILLDAACLNLEIPGEASRKIGEDFREAHPKIPWREI